MIFTKLHLRVALFASAYIYSNPTTSSTTNYLPISEIQQKRHYKKSMDDGKEVYADFCIQCHQANGKGDGINFPP
jgi:cytochrome c